ncbi:MAG: hypothetical protein NTY36_02410 [Deltaproteobacteria bacterium]|nr:hypothetical protein [Deltaproteobacteria bacterium]
MAVLLLGIVILAVPISLGYDSVEKWFQVRWLGLNLTTRLGREKPGKIRKKTTKKKNYGRAIMARFWQKRDLVWELLNRLGRFVLEVLRTLSFRDSEATVSLPDPMWNGVLYGVLTNIHLENVDLSVNFEQRNYAKIWVTVYPYRLALQLAGLLLRLPLLNIIRFAWDLKHQVKRG